MAFTQEEREALTELKGKGYTLNQALGFIASTRLGTSSRVEREFNKTTPKPDDALSDISRGVSGAVDAVKQGVDRDEAINQSDRNPISKAFGKFAGGLRTAGDAVGSLVEGGVRALPYGTAVMDKVDEVVGRGVTKATSSPLAGDIKEGFEKLPDGVQNTLGDVGNAAMGALNLAGALTAPGATRVTSKALAEGLNAFATTGIKDVGEAGIKASINIGLAPEDLMQRVARISKGKQAAFEERAGESVGEYLVNRGIFGDPESITEQLYERMKLSKSRVDSGLAKIQGTHQNGSVTDALDQLLEREGRVSSPNTPSRDIKKVQELKAKHDKKGLTLSEINEVKRLYERNVKLDYISERASDKIALANNVDSSLREFIVKEADKAGFANVKKLNMETTLSKQLLDDLGAEYAGQQGNNFVGLSDAMFLAEAASNPTALAAFGLKKLLSSKSTMSAVARLIAGKNARVGMPEAEFRDLPALPAPAEGAPTQSVNVPVNSPAKTQSTLDMEERANPDVKPPESSLDMNQAAGGTAAAAGAYYVSEDEDSPLSILIAGMAAGMKKGEALKLINQQLKATDKAIAKNAEAIGRWGNDRVINDLNETRKRLLKEREKLMAKD